jgi:hypothetical protein
VLDALRRSVSQLEPLALSAQEAVDLVEAFTEIERLGRGG